MPTLTDEQQAKEVAQIKDTDKWPLYPVLPVKKLGHSFEPGGLGMIFASDVTKLYVHDFPALYAPTPRTEDNGWTITTYESVEALVADGWVGD